MILLREFIESDVERLVEILNDNTVTEYLSTKLPSPYTEEHAHWWINEGSLQGYIKAICYEGILVGCIGVNRGLFEFQRSGEIGFWLARDYWRKGISLTALTQMTAYIFSNTDIVRIYASVFDGNTPSMELLQEAGYKREAVLEKAIYKNGKFFDDHIFTQLKS